MLIFQNVKDSRKRDKIRKGYQDWEGKAPLEEDICLNNNKWIRMSVQRVQDDIYDMLSFIVQQNFMKSWNNMNNRLQHWKKKAVLRQPFYPECLMKSVHQ